MATKSKATELTTIVRAGVKPDRAADNLTISHQLVGGLTSWHKKKVVRVSAPMVRGAHARTVRIHEMLHANNSPATNPKKFHALAVNAIEDVKVHCVYWPHCLPERANRDCLATAHLDARSLPPLAAIPNAEVWNVSLLVALRSLAIADRLRYVGRGRANRIESRIPKTFPMVIVEALKDIVQLAKSKKGKTKAIKAFQALMRSDEEQEKQGSQKGGASTGAASANPMRIVKLPMVEACNSQVKKTNPARSGARINRARLTQAIVSGSTAGLFMRQRYLPGGTYLFDASGSMEISEERLNELCRNVPAATVAYYSGGNQRADGSYGSLVIYSQGGMRAREVDHRQGGNSVDLFAIQWLLQQPGPRTFICDGGFCGGPEGQDIAAAKLIASAVVNGEVTWQQSV
jgi:hypothetical protein